MSTKKVISLAVFTLAISIAFFSCSTDKKSEKAAKVRVPIDSLLQYLSTEELRAAIGAANVVKRNEGNKYFVDLYPGTDRQATIACEVEDYFSKITFDTASIWTSKIGMAPGMTAKEVITLSNEYFPFFPDGNAYFETGPFATEGVRFTITGQEGYFKTHPNAYMGYMNAYPKDSIPDIRVVSVTLFYPSREERTASREFEDKDYPVKKIKAELKTLPWNDSNIDIVTNGIIDKFPLAAFEDKATGNFIVVTTDGISQYDTNCKFTFRTYSPTGKFLYKNDTLRTEDAEVDGSVLPDGDPDCEDPVPPVSASYTLAIDADGNVTLDTDYDLTTCGGSIGQKNTWKGVIENGKFKLVEVVRGEPEIERKDGGGA